MPHFPNLLGNGAHCLWPAALLPAHTEAQHDKLSTQQSKHTEGRRRDGRTAARDARGTLWRGKDDPRIVITGINLPRPTDERTNLTDCPTVGESQSIRPGHNNQAILISHPLPDAEAPPEAANIDWFACTLRLGEDYPLKAVLLDLRKHPAKSSVN